MKNMVIAKYLDGKMVRGSTLDVGNKDTFHLTTVEGETREIRISDLKAVFFVKSLTGAAKFAGGARPLIVGKKVRVKFFDNEEIEGTSIDYAQRKDHFFIFPLDEKSNNERILINRKAARFVTTVDEAPAAAAAAAPAATQKVAPPPDPARQQLEGELYRGLHAFAEQFNAPRTGIDETLSVTYCVLLKKKLSPQLGRYVQTYGRAAWTEFVNAKLADIQRDLGDLAHQAMIRVVNKLTVI